MRKLVASITLILAGCGSVRFAERSDLELARAAAPADFSLEPPLELDWGILAEGTLPKKRPEEKPEVAPQKPAATP